MLNHRPDGSDDTDVFPRSIACGVIIVDQGKRVSAVNSQAARLIGLDDSQVQNQPHKMLPPPLRQIIDETSATGVPQDKQIGYSLGDGREVTVQVTTSLAQTSSGHPVGVVAVLNDLTAAETLVENMRRLDRLASIGTLSASMAHEIKNALVAVRIFVELLVQQNKDAELAGTVNREFSRIDSIVSQILRFAGPAKPTFSSLHLHDVLGHAFRLIEHQLAEKNISIKKSLAASPDLVKGDSYQLEQVFLNLFFNAIEAMEPGGQLSVATDLMPLDPPSRGQLRLTIKDTGSGVPPENLARLFDPFFTTKKHGHGLGLSITRRIIQEHNGTISAESELNLGTTFTVVLPCGRKR